MQNQSGVQSRADIYQSITDKIVAAIEAGAGEWKMPWHVQGGSSLAPINYASERPYRGVNILTLWATAQIEGYSSNKWATYAQWQSEGCQVRRGEKGTQIVFWKALDRHAGGDSEEAPPENDPRRTRFVARGFSVFNADQVDGLEEIPVAADSEIQRIERAERFVSNLGADIRHGGSKAFYVPAQDFIQMPPLNAFSDIVPFYGTVLHELVHWTSHKDRCDRDLKNKFASEAYAAEELVAEIGAAFLCSSLGIENEPRIDHAQYVEHWLKVLKNDKRAIFSAASAAQKAVDWMIEQQPIDISDWQDIDEIYPPVDHREAPVACL